MQAFIANPTILRTHALFDVVQHGDRAAIISKSPRAANSASTPILVIAEIKAAKQHFAKALVSALEKAGAVAFVQAVIDGKHAQIAITAEQFAAGAAERQRYADWTAAHHAWLTGARAAATAFDQINNEGGEGFNPHRHG